MSDAKNGWYFLERAKAALGRAEAATDPAIALVHLEFYEQYMYRAGEQPLSRPKLRIVAKSAELPRR